MYTHLNTTLSFKFFLLACTNIWLLQKELTALWSSPKLCIFRNTILLYVSMEFHRFFPFDGHSFSSAQDSHSTCHFFAAVKTTNLTLLVTLVFRIGFQTQSNSPTQIALHFSNTQKHFFLSLFLFFFGGGLMSNRLVLFLTITR